MATRPPKHPPFVGHLFRSGAAARGV